MIFVKFSIEILDLLLDKTLGHFLWSNLWENPGIYDISKYKIPYVELVRHIITLIASLFSVKQQNSIFSQSRPGIAEPGENGTATVQVSEAKRGLVCPSLPSTTLCYMGVRVRNFLDLG